LELRVSLDAMRDGAAAGERDVPLGTTVEVSGTTHLLRQMAARSKPATDRVLEELAPAATKRSAWSALRASRRLAKALIPLAVDRALFE
jgi:hypothetical protein